MKKIIATALFTLVCLLGSSQNSNSKPSRQETEVWLLDKISNYVQKERYYSFDDDILNKKVSGSNKNIKLNLTNDYILISYEVEEHISNRFMNDGIEIKTNNYSETVKIPLKDLSNKEFIKDSYLVFESKFNSFVTSRTGGYSTTSAWKGVRINANEEENFAERFNKAMNHLLSFIKKSKISEIF
jgi:hypothetical protein